MKHENEIKREHQRQISRRKMLILAAQGAGIIALGRSAYKLQVEQNERFLKLAQNNRVETRLEFAPRGVIYDRQGRRVAENVPNFIVNFDKSITRDPLNTLKKLQSILPLEEEDIQAIIKKIDNHRGNEPILIVDQLSYQDFTLITENLPALEGLQTQIALSRFYPYHELMAHQIGYVGKVSAYDLEQMENPLSIYRLPNAIKGKNGVELRMEDRLRGREGQRILEKNSRQHIVRQLEQRNSVPGEDIELTLDAAFQNYARKRFEGEVACAVIVDVESGDLKLMVSTPSFDPNKFVFGISSQDYSELLNDTVRAPLYNKVVSGQYPPGSTFKMVVALAGLEAGVINAQSAVSCRGKINRGRDIHCWKRSGHGYIDLKNSLKQSCDVFYYENSEKMGISEIVKTSRKLGLGIKYDLPLNLVREGLLGDIEWKKERFGEDWVVGDTINASIGQGYIETTPLQLAIMTARLATGKAVVPNLVNSLGIRPTKRNFEDLGFNEENLRLIREGMYAVVNEQGGTARASRIQADGALWAGKTGTAQTRTYSKAERESGLISNNRVEWSKRDHALFVGYAPYDRPKYAISVIVEHGGGGSKTAAPIARDLMLYALYNGKPPLSAYPASARPSAQAFLASVPDVETIKFAEPLKEEGPSQPIAPPEPS